LALRKEIGKLSTRAQAQLSDANLTTSQISAHPREETRGRGHLRSWWAPPAFFLFF